METLEECLTGLFRPNSDIFGNHLFGPTVTESKKLRSLESAHIIVGSGCVGAMASKIVREGGGGREGGRVRKKLQVGGGGEWVRDRNRDGYGYCASGGGGV